MRDLKKEIAALNDIVLSNITMLSEIPSPTYREQAKAILLAERFSESQLDNCCTDDIGNAIGVLSGTKGQRNILLAAHLDTNFKEKVDHTVRFEQNHIRGVGISDNSIGVAIIASLPTMLEKLNIRLHANLILMGTVHSLGSGNIAGMRSFLDNSSINFDNAICIEGNSLGRISVSSQGMVRGEILYHTPEKENSIYRDTQDTIMSLNLIINRILELRLPRQPLTKIIINSVRCGGSFNTIPSNGIIRFEIESESEILVNEFASVIQNICDEVSARSDGSITLNTIATRRPGGLSFSHPFVEKVRKILVDLQVEPRFLYSTSELSACIDHDIPAVTIGITTSTHANTIDEKVDIAPIPTGIAQLINLLLAIDAGECDEIK